MARTSIVVAFRMMPSGMEAARAGAYLSRARALCLRAQALGGTLVAWGPSSIALAWEAAAMEDAVLVASSIREEAVAGDQAWSGGISLGELEPLGIDGAGTQLAWGPALLAATSLARRARPGEVVVDEALSSAGGGALALVDEEPIEAAEGVRGRRLDLEPSRKRVARSPAEGVDGGRRAREGALAERLRRLARGDETAAAVDALARLRRARARAEGGPPSARCQAALALGMALSLAGRHEEALLEALDALARAKEAGDAKAALACTALLARLYTSAGLPHAATALRDGAGL